MTGPSLIDRQAEIDPHRLVLATLVVTTVAGVFWLLIYFRLVALVLLAALLLGTALRPAVGWLERRGLPRTAGATLLYSIFLVIVAGFVWFGAPLVEQAALVQRQIGELYRSIYESLRQSPSLVLYRLSGWLPDRPPALDLWLPAGGPLTENGFDSLWRFLQPALRTIFHLLAFLGLAYFWTLDGHRYQRAFFLLWPPAARPAMRRLAAMIEDRLSRFILGQGLLCLAVGLLALAAYWLIGLPHAVGLALFAGFMEAVPLVGPFIGAIPALALGMSLSPATALWVALATLVIQQLENMVLLPRIMSRSVGLRPLVTLLLLTALGALFGLTGALVAIPLAVVLHQLLDFLLVRQGTGPHPNRIGRDRVSRLRYEARILTEDIRCQIRHKTCPATPAADQLEDSLESIVLDLESLLARRAEAAP